MSGNRFMARVISAVMALGVVAYMTVYIIQAMSSSYQTAEAVYATIEVTLPVNGWFARDEQTVVSSDTTGAVSETVVAEGAKVARGQELIMSYDSIEAAGTRRDLLALEAQLEQLEQASGGMSPTDIAKTDSRLADMLYSLANLGSAGELAPAYGTAAELKTLVLKRDYTSGRYGEEELNELVEGIESRRAELLRKQEGAKGAVKAPYSGYFSSVTDGYEDILTMDGVLDMSVGELKALATKNVYVSSAVCGKIATSFGWRYAVIMARADAAKLTVNTWITLRFTGDFVGETSVRVLQISEPEGDEVAVVFSCSTLIGDLLPYRRQSAEIVLESFDGVRVPKSALRVNDKGAGGVFVVEGMQAKFLAVNILRETEGYYLVEFNPNATKSVRPGDEIIIGSKNIFDGKIVR